MDIGSFAEQVRFHVGNELDSGHDISIHRVGKNNGVYYTGLQITENAVNISPVIYIDRYYELYEKGGETIESTAAFVMDTYNRERSGGIMQADIRKFLSYDSVRENVVYKLINTEKNRELLEDIPHMEFMDLSIVFQCIISLEETGVASILIHNVHMKLWGVAAEDLYAAAKENTGRLLPYEIKSMAEVLYEIREPENPGQAGHDGYGAGSADSVPMYVLSNRNRVEGAACMLYPGLIRGFAEKAGNSLYIIPSSVHELLLIPTENTEEYAEIRSMIREINDTQVSEEEILSYSLYYYDREEGKIIML
jgi:hypothetical protein